MGAKILSQKKNSSDHKLRTAIRKKFKWRGILGEWKVGLEAATF